MVVLDTNVVNVALSAIEGSLGGGISGSQWIVNAYALAFGALVLSAGHASNHTERAWASPSESRRSP